MQNILIDILKLLLSGKEDWTNFKITAIIGGIIILIVKVPLSKL